MSLEQINFSQQSPKMRKMASQKLYSCFVVIFRSFPKLFPLGSPEFDHGKCLDIVKDIIVKNIHNKRKVYLVRMFPSQKH